MKASKAAQEKLLALQALDSSLIQLDHKARNLPVSKVLDEKTIAHATALIVTGKHGFLLESDFQIQLF